MYAITNLGPNSNVIDVPASWTESDVLTAIQTLMEAGGYTTSASTEAGSTTGDSKYFTMLHHGDIDADYLKGIKVNAVRYTTTTELRLSAYEKGSYVSFTNINTTPLKSIELGTKGCKLYCFIGVGYCIFYARQYDGINEGWAGVCEYTDVMGLPFGAGASDPWSRLVAFDQTSMVVGASQPVDPVSYMTNGLSKVLVSTYACMLTNIGCWGTTLGSTSVANLNSSAVSFIGQPISGYIRNLASSITIMMDANTVPAMLGTMYGFKVLNKGAGNPMDTVTIKQDANGFCNETGAATEHFILTGKGYSNTVLNTACCFAVPK
jgi:hypothetical protein